MKLQLGKSDLSRTVKGGPTIPLVNRYFEEDPTANEQTSLQSRPGLRAYLKVGPVNGPVRAIYSQYGFANNAVFVVTGNEVNRLDQDGGWELLGTLGSSTGAVSMAATEDNLFIADGLALYYSDGTLGDLNAIAVPDGDGVVSVGHIAGYIICVIAQGFGKNGRFYWIQPGAVTIDALDFATAERSPDPVWNVLVVGDQFWLPGPNTTEVWYMTGDGDAPFARYPGRLFDKGIWEGTAVQIKDDVMAVGTDGTVYRIGSEPIVVSTPYIVQRIREAIQASREDAA